MNHEQAATQIFREFGVHWDTLTPTIPLGFEGMAFDPSTVSDKAAGWAHISFEPAVDGLIALGNTLLRQSSIIRVRCSTQSGTGVLRALKLADHALLFYQRGLEGLRFSQIGIIRLGDRQGWWSCFAQSNVSYDIMLQTTPPDPAALARRPDTAGPLAVATPTTRKLVDASISVNTRRAYAGALRRLDAWRGDAPVDDARLAAYLGELFEAGRAPATAALAVAAVRFRAKLAAILATAERPRTDGRGVESHTTAQRRGRTDAVIAGLLFMAGLRRAEVSALEWRDAADASDGDGVLITVRTSKTNQEGDTADVRYLKNGAAAAFRTLRTDRPDAAPTDRVIGLSPLQIQRRFTAAARAAGIEARLTAHSGRVGLASELTARGASTTEVMLAGNWRTARMVAHYSAGATAERGAVAKYL